MRNREPSHAMLNTSGLSKSEVLAQLPSKFTDEFGGLLSVEGITALVHHFGGTRILVPKGDDPTTAVGQVLSSADRAALCKHAGGSAIDVPIGKRIARYIRDKEIVAARKAGHSNNEIARQFGLCERSVRLALKRCRENGIYPQA